MPALADAADPLLRSQSVTQMSSAPEVVYVSSVSDPTVRTQDFNASWKFRLGDASGAESQTFDDSSWDQVTLPHDYSIDQDYTKSGEAESAYKPGGVGWYRKSFELSKELEGKSIRLDFDGVYMDSTVWVNGHKLGNHPNGYTPFSFDITPYVKAGAENVIAVKVNAQTPSSRWYSGAGIGRDVDVVVTDKLHVAKDGVQVTTPNLATEAGGPVTTKIKTTVENDGDSPASIQVVQTVFVRGGDPAAAVATATTERQVAAGATDTFEATATTAAAPSLWDVDHPNLYTVRTEVKRDGAVVDTYDTDFGYRYFSFDANTGFSLNGKPMKIKGVCMHHDQGALGSVAADDAIVRQVSILKDMGANSIRTSHNTPSRELIEACNEQGILLDVEFFDGWTSPKNGNSKDYARFFNQAIGESEIIGAAPEKTWAQFDLETSIARDYNAPSIIMWSLGNEMTEGTTRGISGFRQIQKNLITWAQAADPTRPVTTGDNKFKGGSNELYPQGIADAGGIVGLNYAGGGVYDRTHRDRPSWRILGSETASSVNSRGVYYTHGQHTATKQLSAYDYSKVNWGHYASNAWYDVITRDFVAGEYVWTGFDYLGEPTPWNGTDPGAKGGWPSSKNSYFGIIDTAGLPKDSYYFYQSQWNDAKHTLHMLPAWNEDAVLKDIGGKVDVVVYTDAPTVKLFFTPAGSTERQEIGTKSFSSKTTPAGFSYQIYEGADKNANAFRNLYLTWKVPYADGTLTAEAYDVNGNKIDTSSWDGRQSVTTAGAAAKLVASVNRDGMSANGTDLAYVTVSVLDAEGNLVPRAADNVTFKVDGSAELAGIDNGNSPDHQSYRDDNRDAFSGQLVGIVRASRTAGAAKVTVSSPGLAPATVEIPVAEAPNSAAAKSVDSLFYARYQYVKTGTALSLPETIQVRYTDGSAEDAPVTWDAVDEAKLAEAGTFTVSGTVAGVRASTIVTVLDNIVALANYSTTTPVGQAPVLPDARPAIQADGTILNASFPVAWDEAPEGAFDKAGTVVLTGTANVFGRDMELTATVRVQKESVQVGANVAPAAALSQDIPEGKQNDTLAAITDGSTTIGANSSGGPNPTAWTNYTYSQEGHNTAQLTFRYATQQRLGEAVIHFFTDSYSARLPEAGTTVFEVSENGEDWVPLPVEEKIGQASGRVTPYTYTFAPTTATYVRVTVKNSSEVLSGRKPCTGITEVELKSVTGSFTTNRDAALEALTVNGKEVPASALEGDSWSTPAIVAAVETEPRGNAAVTVLPEHEGVVRLLLESEDHNVRKTFAINLGVEEQLAADSGLRDYPVDDMTFTAGSEEPSRGLPNEGPVRLAFDKNDGTIYHSAWAGTSVDNLWVTMELKEPTAIDALRYLPRLGGLQNGTVMEGKLLYSENGNTWQDAGAVTWVSDAKPYEPGWKILELDEPITAKYFRFATVKSFGDGNRMNQFMSAAEIRLRTAPVKTDISAAALTAPDTLEVDRVNGDEPARFDPTLVTVTLKGEGAEDQLLTYGVDYVLEYANNEAEGTATVSARGIDAYEGTTAARSFTVKVKEPVLEGIAVSSQPAKTAYTVGETLDPSGIVLTLAMSDGTTKTVSYGADTAGDFSFTPALDTAFAVAGTVDVTVGYGGKTATISVTVAEAPEPEQPDPDSKQPDNGTTGTQKPGQADSDVDGTKKGDGSRGGKKAPKGLPKTGDLLSMAALAVAAGTGAVLVGGGRKLRRRK
ncbi:MAG: DUF4982 domain-containing protein [Coriobacteriaceae bacterium]|nr:DUF4982 domain-containing protein [Coriobacteriaceae bacterium]